MKDQIKSIMNSSNTTTKDQVCYCVHYVMCLTNINAVGLGFKRFRPNTCFNNVAAARQCTFCYDTPLTLKYMRVIHF